jgi:hypothetical protein
VRFRFLHLRTFSGKLGRLGNLSPLIIPPKNLDFFYVISLLFLSLSSLPSLQEEKKVQEEETSPEPCSTPPHKKFLLY